METIVMFAWICLIGAAAATPMDFVHVTTTPKQALGTGSGLVHWTTGVQTKGSTTLNHTKTQTAVKTTVQPVKLAATTGSSETTAHEPKAVGSTSEETATTAAAASKETETVSTTEAATTATTAEASSAKASSAKAAPAETQAPAKQSKQRKAKKHE
ncbi:Hypothetical predicted protein [Drosophila guanche]|uniref:Uncharacterized protein n=1 Tax=Drosophila guanche TaxID=7266 RepID=A0A3B0JZ79_DROGU|nr:Hypothetical predicted protein [Drosophila guanche]